MNYINSIINIPFLLLLFSLFIKGLMNSLIVHLLIGDEEVPKNRTKY